MLKYKLIPSVDGRELPLHFLTGLKGSIQLQSAEAMSQQVLPWEIRELRGAEVKWKVIKVETFRASGWYRLGEPKPLTSFSWYPEK